MLNRNVCIHIRRLRFLFIVSLLILSCTYYYGSRTLTIQVLPATISEDRPNFSVLSSVPPTVNLKTAHVCENTGFMFFNKCYCRPGWQGDDCTIPTASNRYVPNKTLCPAWKSDFNIETYTFQMWNSAPAVPCAKSHWGQCKLLCFWQPELGIVQVPSSVWSFASDKEHAMWKGFDTDKDRDAEHVEGFGGYKKVPRNLGRLLEIGAGPFSQTKTILSTLKNFDLKNITFAEPNIFRYKTEVPHCTYKTGRLKGFEQYPLTLISKRVEELAFVETMDTVVQINVVEHVTNAVTFFGKFRLLLCVPLPISHMAQKLLFAQ